MNALEHCSWHEAMRTSKTSHAWSTSLRVGGTCTLTVPPSAAASAVSAMRSSRSAICDRYACERRTEDAMLIRYCSHVLDDSVLD